MSAEGVRLTKRVPDDRYPYVYHDRATWGRVGVSVAKGDDSVWVTTLLENKPGGRWQLVQMTADEAEQLGLRLVERANILRASLAALTAETGGRNEGS